MPKKNDLAYNATITERIDLTESLALFRVRSDKELPAFVPGQYATMGLNHPELGNTCRPYSIASAPEAVAKHLEFYIRYVEKPESDNPLTHLLFKTKSGDRIWMGPKLRGHFTIPATVGDTDTRHRIMVAAGTGLAPFASMVRSEAARNGSVSDKWIILHGAKFESDLGYRDELMGLMNNSRRLRYIPTLSRGERPAWQGAIGRVESLLAPERIGLTERALGFSAGSIRPENAVVFICGLKGTIGQTILHLIERGYVPDDTKLRYALHIPKDTPNTLFFEQYDTDPVIDTNDAALMESLRGKLKAAGVKLDPSVALQAGGAGA